jgi:hypothetical protein
VKPLALFAFAAVFMAGCQGEAARPGEVSTDNKAFTVGRLFTHEGYSVYRFYDGGDAVYYVVPAGPAERVALTTSWQTKHWVGVAGKGGHYEYDRHQVTTTP